MARGIVVLIALVAAAVTFPCVSGCETLAESISKIPNLSTLHKIIMVVGDDQFFSSPTFDGLLLAPVDTAFEKLLSDMNTTLSAFMADRARLEKILEDHLIPSPPPELEDGTKLSAQSGIPISVTAESSWLVFVYPDTVASVVIPKIAACDAVFYVVDRVFSPETSDSSSKSTAPASPTPEPTSEFLFSDSQQPEVNVTRLTTSGPVIPQEPFSTPGVESNVSTGTTLSPEALLPPVSELATQPPPALSGFFPPSQNVTTTPFPTPDALPAPAPEPFVEFNTTTTSSVPSTAPQTSSLLNANASEPTPIPEPVLTDMDAAVISREPVPTAELIPAPGLAPSSNSSTPLQPRELPLESPPASSSRTSALQEEPAPVLEKKSEQFIGTLPGEVTEDGESGGSSEVEPEQATRAPKPNSARSPSPSTNSGRYYYSPKCVLILM
ncbi:hypothetical protein BSKO_10722 [Bryopsis sp. KO-2023]|nr:hypothetical protein BSKO_10722 [Bryopsis sp. KO-2023]